MAIEGEPLKGLAGLIIMLLQEIEFRIDTLRRLEIMNFSFSLFSILLRRMDLLRDLL